MVEEDEEDEEENSPADANKFQDNFTLLCVELVVTPAAARCSLISLALVAVVAALAAAA